MAITLINPFEVQTESNAEHEAALIAAFNKTTSVFANKPGYLETKLYRSLDPSARFRFVNIAHWRDAEVYKSAVGAFPPCGRRVCRFSGKPHPV